MRFELFQHYLLILIHVISYLLLLDVSFCLLHSLGFVLLLNYVMKRVVVLAEIIGQGCLSSNASLLKLLNFLINYLLHLLSMLN